MTWFGFPNLFFDNNLESHSLSYFFIMFDSPTDEDSCNKSNTWTDDKGTNQDGHNKSSKKAYDGSSHAYSRLSKGVGCIFGWLNAI